MIIKFVVLFMFIVSNYFTYKNKSFINVFEGCTIKQKELIIKLFFVIDCIFYFLTVEIITTICR